METAIPHVAEAAVQLKKLVEAEGDLNTAVLQKTILSSPALTAMVLRSASSAAAGSTAHVTDVRRAILVLGKRSLHSIAMAAIMQAVISERVKTALLDPRQFVLHSTFVGIMARYLFELQLREHGHESQFRSDEIFAAGVLHDVGLGLFAVTHPKEFKNLVETSRLHMLTLSDEYLRDFDETPYLVTVEAMKCWNLSPTMIALVEGLENPEASAIEPRTVACLAYAEYLAETFGFGLTRNVANTECSEFVLNLVGLPQDEEVELCEMIGEIAWDCLPAASAA